MSKVRTSSRFPSAYGHTPSYRSYLRHGVLAGAFPYDVHLGPVANPPGFSAYWPGYSYDLATPPVVVASSSSSRLGYLDLAGSPRVRPAREYTSYSCRWPQVCSTVQ